MKRADILDTAKEYVTKDRAASHGDMECNFGRIAALWTIQLADRLDGPVKASDVALMMALLKVARACSNPAHLDNWIDLAGYAACGGELMTPE